MVSDQRGMTIARPSRLHRRRNLLLLATLALTLSLAFGAPQALAAPRETTSPDPLGLPSVPCTVFDTHQAQQHPAARRIEASMDLVRSGDLSAIDDGLVGLARAIPEADNNAYLSEAAWRGLGCGLLEYAEQLQLRLRQSLRSSSDYLRSVQFDRQGYSELAAGMECPAIIAVLNSAEDVLRLVDGQDPILDWLQSLPFPRAETVGHEALHCPTPFSLDFVEVKRPMTGSPVALYRPQSRQVTLINSIAPGRGETGALFEFVQGTVGGEEIVMLLNQQHAEWLVPVPIDQPCPHPFRLTVRTQFSDAPHIQVRTLEGTAPCIPTFDLAVPASRSPSAYLDPATTSP